MQFCARLCMSATRGTAHLVSDCESVVNCLVAQRWLDTFGAHQDLWELFGAEIERIGEKSWLSWEWVRAHTLEDEEPDLSYIQAHRNQVIGNSIADGLAKEGAKLHAMTEAPCWVLSFPEQLQPIILSIHHAKEAIERDREQLDELEKNMRAFPKQGRQCNEYRNCAEMAQKFQDMINRKEAEVETEHARVSESMCSDSGEDDIDGQQHVCQSVMGASSSKKALKSSPGFGRGPRRTRKT